MITVAYTYQFGYLPVDTRSSFPGLPLQVQNPHVPAQIVEVQAHLDSGAGYSLFDGWIATAIGLELLSGRTRRYAPTHGGSLEARVHEVVLVHPVMGSFDLEVGLSTDRIRRNLLGRDFFNFVQIGFRERELAFYVTPTP